MGNPKKTIICTQCGKTALVGKYSTGKFCSSTCSCKWHSGPNHPIYGKHQPDGKCYYTKEEYATLKQ